MIKKIIRNSVNAILIVLFVAYCITSFVNLLEGLKIALIIIVFLIIRFYFLKEENDEE